MPKEACGELMSAERGEAERGSHFERRSIDGLTMHFPCGVSFCACRHSAAVAKE
jgi:hypothetical protein